MMQNQFQVKTLILHPFIELEASGRYRIASNCGPGGKDIFEDESQLKIPKR